MTLVETSRYIIFIISIILEVKTTLLSAIYRFYVILIPICIYVFFLLS